MQRWHALVLKTARQNEAEMETKRTRPMRQDKRAPMEETRIRDDATRDGSTPSAAPLLGGKEAHGRGRAFASKMSEPNEPSRRRRGELRAAQAAATLAASPNFRRNSARRCWTSRGYSTMHYLFVCRSTSVLSAIARVEPAEVDAEINEKLQKEREKSSDFCLHNAVHAFHGV
jgi:hypothetical protein